MLVKAAPGLQCPMEGKPREYVTDAPEGVEVADSPYYRRLVLDESLQEVQKAAQAPAAPAQLAVAPVPAAAAPAVVISAPSAPATSAPAASDKNEGGVQ